MSALGEGVKGVLYEVLYREALPLSAEKVTSFTYLQFTFTNPENVLHKHHFLNI